MESRGRRRMSSSFSLVSPSPLSSLSSFRSRRMIPQSIRADYTTQTAAPGVLASRSFDVMFSPPSAADKCGSPAYPS